MPGGTDLQSVRPPRKVAFAVLFVVGLAFLPGLFRPPPYPFLGKPAPAVEVPVVGGEPFSLEGARGKTVVLGFWASWSDLGEKQIKILDDVKKKHGDVVVVGIDTADDRAELEKWLAAHPVEVPVGFDDDRAARALEVNNLPMVIVVGPNGRVADVGMGVTEADDVSAMIQRAR